MTFGELELAMARIKQHLLVKGAPEDMIDNMTVVVTDSRSGISNGVEYVGTSEASDDDDSGPQLDMPEGTIFLDITAR